MIRNRLYTLWFKNNNSVNKYWPRSIIFSMVNLRRVFSVYMCSLKILWQNRIPAYISIAVILHCTSKTGPLLYCNKILQHIMKCSTIQHINVKRGHVASIIAHTVFKMASRCLHSSNASSTTVYCMPDQITQTVLSSYFMFQKSFKVIFTLLWQIFYQFVSSELFKLTQIFKQLNMILFADTHFLDKRHTL